MAKTDRLFCPLAMSAREFNAARVLSDFPGVSFMASQGFCVRASSIDGG